MIDDIKAYAEEDAKAGKWDAVVGKLSAIYDETLNTTHWTLGMISALAGIELAGKIAAVVKAAANSGQPTAALFESIFVALSTTGIQLHTPDRQAMIDQLGVGLDAAEVAAVKALGVRQNKRYPSITAKEAETVWKDSETSRLRSEFLRDTYNPAFNTHIAPLLDSGDVFTTEGMATALEAMAAQIRGV